MSLSWSRNVNLDHPPASTKLAEADCETQMPVHPYLLVPKLLEQLPCAVPEAAMSLGDLADQQSVQRKSPMTVMCGRIYMWPKPNISLQKNTYRLLHAITLRVAKGWLPARSFSKLRHSHPLAPEP